MAVFLAGIYAAYKGRFSFLMFFPFLGIIVKELTYFGRAEILLALMEFFFSFFLFRHLLNNDSSQRFKFSKKNAFFAATMLLILVISSTSFIRIGRGAQENYIGANRGLKQLEENFIISPSIYLYMSSDVGVFSKYLAAGGEKAKFGQNTFLIFYNLIAQLEEKKNLLFFKKVIIYQCGQIQEHIFVNYMLILVYQASF